MDIDAEPANDEHQRAGIRNPSGRRRRCTRPYVKHYQPDANPAWGWLSRRQPDKGKDRQEGNVTGSVRPGLAQMTPEERGAFALDLAERARQRLIEAGVIIEHEPAPAPADQPEAEPEERGVAG